VSATNQIPQLDWSYRCLTRVLRSFAWRTHRHALKAEIIVAGFYAARQVITEVGLREF